MHRHTKTKDGQHLEKLLAKIKSLAKEYRNITGRPLGVTAELAEYEAVRILGLNRSPVRQPGYDATRLRGAKQEKIQIKGRVILNPVNPGQKLGKIDLTKIWDTTLLVLLNEDFDAIAIYEATRSSIRKALRVPGSKARNIRGQLSVSKFRSIGSKVWP